MHLATLTTWIELGFSLGATPIVLLYLYALITSPFDQRVKVFLTSNGLGLLFLTTSHVSVAVSRLVKPQEFLGEGVVANLPLFLHQLAYNSCSISMLLITIERMVSGLRPRHNKRVSTWVYILTCITAEIFIALPCTMLVQDGPVINGSKLYSATELSQKISVLLNSFFDATALLMVIASFFFSSVRYNREFSKAELATRYQLKEVVTLTRLLIPICCSSLLFKFAVLILAFIAFGDLSSLDLLFTIVRFCCTAAAVVEPLLMITRHRLLQKRLRNVFGFSMKGVVHPEPRDSRAVADVYFDSLKQDMNKNLRN